MRTRLLAIIAALATVAAAQKPDWPQPIVHGALVVWSGEGAVDSARHALETVSRLDRGTLVVARDAEKAAQRWKGALRATIVTEPTVAQIEAAGALWIEVPLSGDLAAAAIRVKESGGAVAVSKDVLKTAGLRALLPYLGEDEDDSGPSPLTLELEDGSILVADGRHLSTRGEGTVTIGVSSQEKVTLRSRDRADLVALRRRAIEGALPAFPPKVAKRAEVKSGTLFIVGGGGMPDGLLERFIEACGGPDAPIVYVPCEFAEEINGVPGFVRTLERAGAKNVTWIHTKDRVKADTDQEFLKPLSEAKGVWFGGGRQWNLVDSYMDTQAHELMRKVLERGGAIGGSSAGASIQAEFLARGDPLGNLNIIAPGYLRGLGFLPGAAVDQHFTQRGRHKDMTSLMEQYPQLLGIGIDEATAIVVAGSVAEVAGRGQVFFYDWSKGKPEGDTDHTALKAGERYDLAARKRVG